VLLHLLVWVCCSSNCISYDSKWVYESDCGLGCMNSEAAGGLPHLGTHCLGKNQNGLFSHLSLLYPHHLMSPPGELISHVCLAAEVCPGPQSHIQKFRGASSLCLGTSFSPRAMGTQAPGEYLETTGCKAKVERMVGLPVQMRVISIQTAPEDCLPEMAILQTPQATYLGF